jgi:hypothetical protein
MAQSPEQRLAEKARKAFTTNYDRLLSDQKAYHELKEYKSKLAAISMNKAVMYGLVPITVLAIAGVHYKYPGKYKMYLERGAMGVGAIALLTNLRAYNASSQLPFIESRLIDKYVITLPEGQLDRYSSNKHVFPGAK